MSSIFLSIHSSIFLSQFHRGSSFILWYAEYVFPNEICSKLLLMTALVTLATSCTSDRVKLACVPSATSDSLSNCLHERCCSGTIPPLAHFAQYTDLHVIRINTVIATVLCMHLQLSDQLLIFTFWVHLFKWVIMHSEFNTSLIMHTDGIYKDHSLTEISTDITTFTGIATRFST